MPEPAAAGGGWPPWGVIVLVLAVWGPFVIPAVVFCWVEAIRYVRGLAGGRAESRGA